MTMKPADTVSRDNKDGKPSDIETAGKNKTIHSNDDEDYDEEYEDAAAVSKPEAPPKSETNSQSLKGLWILFLSSWHVGDRQTDAYALGYGPQRRVSGLLLRLPRQARGHRGFERAKSTPGVRCIWHEKVTPWLFVRRCCVYLLSADAGVTADASPKFEVPESHRPAENVSQTREGTQWSFLPRLLFDNCCAFDFSASKGIPDCGRI
eukprot:GHVU01217115.1.p1 GENE.GHVU01217115.1~~GHVU01217115.1.p1  ORF type:complete len:207 (+),score=15.93 GHVU01217115.1:2-622(+)